MKRLVILGELQYAVPVSIRYLFMNISCNMKPLEECSEPDSGQMKGFVGIQKAIYRLVGKCHTTSENEEAQEVLGQYISWIKRPNRKNCPLANGDQSYYHVEEPIFSIGPTEENNIRIIYWHEEIAHQLILEVSLDHDGYDYFTGEYIFKD